MPLLEVQNVRRSFGGLLAHYTVHPASFWFQFVANLIPYSWAKSWHLQLAIFWIATAWLATGLFIAPAISRPICSDFCAESRMRLSARRFIRPVSASVTDSSRVCW